MKLRKVAIQRLPGIDHPFELEDLGDGLNIIVGPNGVGKSRLCAGIRALLWHEREVRDGGLAASATFEHEDAQWRVERDGTLHRWQREGIGTDAPVLPGVRLEGCFFLGLRDLLDDSDRAGRDLAGEIRRQMSGGFDLDAVEAHFAASLPPRVGSSESKALSKAENEIRKAERSQADLAHGEQELELLETRTAEANSAGGRLEHYKTAISLQQSCRDYSQCKEELGRLPEALANFDGKEIERLDAIEEDLASKRRERQQTTDALRNSRSTACDTHLAEPIDAAVLDTWRLRAEKLADLERRTEDAREEATASDEATGAWREALGAHAAAEPLAPPAVDDVADLFAFLRESHELSTRRQALQERLSLLTSHEFSRDDAQRLELLKRGIEPLRAWLRAPDSSAPTNAAQPRVPRAWYLTAAAALAATAAVLHVFTSSFAVSALLFGAAVGLALAGWLSALRRTEERESPDWRSIAEQQFPETIDKPASWSPEAVTERLRQLEDESAQLDANQKRGLYRAADRAALEQSLSSLETNTVELEQRRRSLAARLALDALRPDADMVDLARTLDASRAAHAEVRSNAAALDELERSWGRLLDGISVYVRNLGENPPSDSAAARAAVRSLEERDRALRNANADLIREEENLRKYERQIEKLEADRAAIFRLAGVAADDRPALGRLVSELDRYRALVRRCEELASHIGQARTDLEAAGESALAEFDTTRLREERAALEERANQAGALNQQIGEINSSVRGAREGHVLEDAIAKKEAAANDLHDRRDRALTAAAGKFLIGQVRIEHETNQMPRVLERTRSRFGAFTHHRYELNVSPDRGGLFMAVDTRSGQGLSPDKLSDGTRAQLILAARLAFAEEAERGADLPLFLDEALDHSDPARFHAIARSLARMAADDGRQVFYLSNDPTDVDRFRSAFEQERCDLIETIDLGAIRGQPARVDSPAALHVPPLASVPDPSGLDAERYGEAIGVTHLEPDHDPFSQHVYYLLREDLSVLHELLRAQIETVGQCRNLLKGGSEFAREIVAKSAIGAQLEARIALFETFCLAWREGRGCKVGRMEIEHSGAVTAKYLEAVVAITAEFDGDADRLLGALRERKDARVRGYRSRSVDELERFFVEHGHIDDRPVLDEKQIVAHGIGTPAANQLSPEVATELLHQWWSLSEFVA